MVFEFRVLGLEFRNLGGKIFVRTGFLCLIVQEHRNSHREGRKARISATLNAQRKGLGFSL